MLKMTFASLVIAMLAVGCASKNSEPVANNTPITEVTPTPAVTPTPTATVTPTLTAPDSGTDITTTPGAGAAAGKKYTIKRGDTLWSIAKASYGDGKQYTKIVAANPGVSPQTLKVGQQITIP